MSKQNLSEFKTAPWFKVDDGFYAAQLTDVTTTNKGGQFRFRYTFALFNSEDEPLLEKSVDAAAARPRRKISSR